MISKRVIIAVFFIFILGIIIFDFSTAEYGKEIKLTKGKNYLFVNQTLYANEFVLMSKDIEYVAYFDEFLNRSVGFVNAFGGIGQNFLIEQGREYEVGVRQNINLMLHEAGS